MGDTQGVEVLAGESEAEYVARQQRLREEAAARMRAKFGSSGGLNGRLGGIGSDGRSSCGHHSQGGTASGYLGSAYEVLPSASAVSAGLGSAASVVGSIFGKVAETASVAARSVAIRASMQSGGRQSGCDDACSTDISDLLSGSSNYQEARHGSGTVTESAVDVAKGGSAERDPRDLSDLLRDASLDGPTASHDHTSHDRSSRSTATVVDDFSLDENWGSGGGQDWGSDGRHVTPIANNRPIGGGALASRSKKVAAKKSNSSNWDDDWGDAW